MAKLAEMTIGQIVGGSVGILAILSVFVEFAPIKINPLSAILTWIGDRTNKGITAKIVALEKNQKDLEKNQKMLEQNQKELDEKLEERAAVNCRIRILRFSDELRRNVKHSQESFGQVISDLDQYERYCVEHPKFKNNKTIAAKARIMQAYDGCMEQNDFL